MQGFCTRDSMTQHAYNVRRTTLLTITCMADALIQLERIKAIQESICGFLLDEVINPTGEFYENPKISVGRADPNKDISEDDEAPKDS